MADLKLYDPFSKMQFTDEHCFLCGITITTADRTPVFGEWMQKKYNLENKELLLLDKSITTFSQLTIPCCNQCHTNYILPLEEEIEKASEADYEGIKLLDPKRLFQWIGKMYYGTLVTELIREKDPLIMPENPVSENPQMLGKFRTFYQVLQSLRVPMVFSDFQPCSLFILQVEPTEDNLPFEYQDELSTMAFSIKLGPVVIVCKLLDNGIISKAMGRMYKLIESRQLHPIQVAEFKAQVFYAAYIFNVVPDYFIRTIKPDDKQLVLDTLIDDVTNEVFNPWEPVAYAHMLEEMLKPWSIREQQILADPTRLLTFLTDEKGEFKTIEHFAQ
ncbi:hypothetical protein JAO76_15680 [Pontibacter sp. BT310]|uniref:HNH endonuclease n=1 Tax=Pontibacter populi TaxID=890055 RepID=A0ABS6XES6_9BACT|nr:MULTISPECIES: hypothetical protein [Pontibacter]MBJ6119649.1 hypothetical protein [Pontibacter sp. BT310]MBR0572076.1 hypothetical protein [Microvirga sp. STS03]MBW3366502.1 hypothetical protein [Pontibacter populi]